MREFAKFSCHLISLEKLVFWQVAPSISSKILLTKTLKQIRSKGSKSINIWINISLWYLWRIFGSYVKLLNLTWLKRSLHLNFENFFHIIKKVGERYPEIEAIESDSNDIQNYDANFNTKSSEYMKLLFILNLENLTKLKCVFL